MKGWLPLVGTHDVGRNTGMSMENENDAEDFAELRGAGIIKK
jgi:hypothetical protein